MDENGATKTSWSLNAAKTDEIVIDFRRNKSSIVLVTKGKEVRIDRQYKYLGTVIDDNLEWTTNMEACYKKANQRMHFPRKLKNFKLNNNILYLFFQSVVQSILLYNQVCNYSNARKADTERLDRITAAARKITRRQLGHLPPSVWKQVYVNS